MRLSFTLLFAVLFSACSFTTVSTVVPNQKATNAELEFLEVVNQKGVHPDEKVQLLLLQVYINAKEFDRGISFYEAKLKAELDALTAQNKSFIHSSLGILYGLKALATGIPARLFLAFSAIDHIEQARKLSDASPYFARWTSGVVYSQFPSLLGKRDQALADLKWTIDHQNDAQLFGFNREAFFHYARLLRDDDKTDEAQKYLSLSGYKTFVKEMIFVSNYSFNKKTGLAFVQPAVSQAVAGRCFTVSGADFTEYHFIISDDGRDLLMIDMGSNELAAEKAFRRFQEAAPNAPPLTTILMTHAHYDHVGGINFFKRQFPNAKIYASALYTTEVPRYQHTPVVPRYIFGTDYDLKTLDAFKPDVLISSDTAITVGGTTIRFLPVKGGETEDALLIHFPKESLLFVGDVLMPMFGDPGLNQGSLEEFFVTVERIVALDAKIILHGHHILSFLYDSNEAIDGAGKMLKWLYDNIEQEILNGKSRTELHEANFIPPDYEKHPRAHIPYLISREFFINRYYKSRFGLFNSSHAEEFDNLSNRDFGAMLSHYFNFSERDVVGKAEAMMQKGDYELALRVLLWAKAAFPSSNAVAVALDKASQGLIEKNQIYGVFKFGLYNLNFAKEVDQLSKPTDK